MDKEMNISIRNKCINKKINVSIIDFPTTAFPFVPAIVPSMQPLRKAGKPPRPEVHPDPDSLYH